MKTKVFIMLFLFTIMPIFNSAYLCYGSSGVEEVEYHHDTSEFNNRKILIGTTTLAVMGVIYHKVPLVRVTISTVLNNAGRFLSGIWSIGARAMRTGTVQ